MIPIFFPRNHILAGFSVTITSPSSLLSPGFWSSPADQRLLEFLGKEIEITGGKYGKYKITLRFLLFFCFNFVYFIFSTSPIYRITSRLLDLPVCQTVADRPLPVTILCTKKFTVVDFVIAHFLSVPTSSSRGWQSSQKFLAM